MLNAVNLQNFSDLCYIPMVIFGVDGRERGSFVLSKADQRGQTIMSVPEGSS
jgi:hypothetical protein